MPVRLSSPIWYSTCVGFCHTLLRSAFFKIAPRHCERPAAFRIKKAGRSKLRAGVWPMGKTKAAGRSGWSLRAAYLSGARGCVCSTIHLLARVKDPQNFNDAVPHAVGQYVWVSDKDQFSRPGDTPRATGLREMEQFSGSPPDFAVYFPGQFSVITCDMAQLGVKVAGRGA